MTSLFISDLHLSPGRPEKLALFKALLEGPARNAEALYILGDLVDRFWVGVDDTTALTTEIIAALAGKGDGGHVELRLDVLLELPLVRVPQVDPGLAIARRCAQQLAIGSPP